MDNAGAPLCPATLVAAPRRPATLRPARRLPGDGEAPHEGQAPGRHDAAPAEQGVARAAAGAILWPIPASADLLAGKSFLAIAELCEYHVT